MKTFKKTITKTINDEIFEINIRFNDECKNGKNEFAITADVYKNNGTKNKPKKGSSLKGGCIHDDIARIAPEFKKFLKWHLFSEKGPMYYIENTLYFVSGKDAFGRKAGEPSDWGYFIKFKGFPIRQKISKGFAEALEKIRNEEKKNIKIVEVEGTDKKYKDYTFSCYPCSYCACPFSSYRKAEEVLKAIQNFDFDIISEPISFSKGKEIDLDAARRAAYWLDATDEELTQPPEKLKEALLARLPALIDDFLKDMEELKQLLNIE
jgi:hypothetical protein